MKKSFLVLMSVSCLATGSALAQNDLRANAKSQFQPLPITTPSLKGIESAPARVELGKMLYFEPRLSESHAISCNSCHIVGMGGADAQKTSIGHRWQRGSRNAPTVLNAIFNTAQFWDGRAEDLRAQAGGPLINPIEMATTEQHVVEQLKGIPGYAEPFRKAFPGQQDPITFANVRDAIALFEATLITPNAPFDRWLAGDDRAMTASQTEGLKLFMEKGCSSCHNGINIGGGMYAPFGVVEKPGADLLPPQDHGRFMVTKTASDEYVFKVPTLRNIALTPPYFHTGESWDLRQAVAVMGKSQLGTELTDQEIDRVTDFMNALTGEQPEVVYPLLPPSVATTPRPQP
jgi:cytochrome c peroxidase